MTINWRQRAPILRVLAAVYAELGEDTFKGRYGKIARLYGNEATYDAIKSFFAKEIVKMAEDLKAGVTDHRHVFNEIPHGQQSGTIRRPARLTFDDNDDEIIVTGVREVEMSVRRTEPVRNVRQRRTPHESLNNVYKLNSPVRESVGINDQDSEYFPSVTPVPSVRAEARTKPPNIRTGKQPQRRKRPHSSIDEPEDPLMSFGYVTSLGKHRCALCSTELPSADILRKHESMSELHLANLKDPGMVSRGYTALVQCTKVSEAASQPQNQLNQVQPSVSGFGRQEEASIGPQYRPREQSNTPYRELGRNLPNNEDEAMSDTIEVAQPHRDRVQHPPQNSNANTEHRETENSPDPDIEVTDHSVNDKTAAPPQSVSVVQSARLETPMLSQDKRATLTQQQKDHPANSTECSHDSTRPEDVPPTWMVQNSFFSRMDRLAKKYMDEHLELKADIYQFMQDMQANRGGGMTQMRDKVRESVTEQAVSVEK